jgi:hypothetical protein
MYRDWTPTVFDGFIASYKNLLLLHHDGLLPLPSRFSGHKYLYRPQYLTQIPDF